MQHVRDVGPIPRGEWWIIPAPMNIPLGSGRNILFALPLRPLANNNVWSTNRDYNSFYIHGDNPTHRGDSSTGCIICNLNVRQEIVRMGGGPLIVSR